MKLNITYKSSKKKLLNLFSVFFKDILDTAGQEEYR